MGCGLHHICMHACWVECARETTATCEARACGAAGNLVASLLSSYLNTTMCTIAHALEKTKYPDADVHWCAPCCAWLAMWL